MALTAVASQNLGVLPILFRDEHLVAVHKPSGLLVHRTKLDAGERRCLLQMLRAQLRLRVYPVHRLDKGASGVMLFALRREVASALGEVVRHCRLASHLRRGRARPRRPSRARSTTPSRRGSIRPSCGATRLPALTRPPRPTLTRYRRLASAELPHRVDRYATSRYSLLQLEPLTGRRHQLRRHLHHLSHPIIGDSTYGKGRHNRLFTRLFGCRRLLLACVELRFDHPLTGASVTVTAPLADDLAPVLDGLGWTQALPSGLAAAALLTSRAVGFASGRGPQLERLQGETGLRGHVLAGVDAGRPQPETDRHVLRAGEQPPRDPQPMARELPNRAGTGQFADLDAVHLDAHASRRRLPGTARRRREHEPLLVGRGERQAQPHARVRVHHPGVGRLPLAPAEPQVLLSVLPRRKSTTVPAA